MLKVENLTVEIGKKDILKDISLEIKKGEVVILRAAGKTFSGKSTVPRISELWHYIKPLAAGGSFRGARADLMRQSACIRGRLGLRKLDERVCRK